MEINKFIQELSKEIQKTDDEILKGEQMARLKEVAKVYDGEDKIISSLDLAKQIRERGEEFTMMSGYGGLDDILKGFRLKQLVVIAAPTKSGKTSFCIDLTTKIREHNPLWFPFEEGAEELITKFIERNEEPPLFYTPEKITGNTLVWIEKKIIEGIAKFNSRVIFIDHLHFIVPFSSERQDLQIGQTMRELKTMAKKWNVTIMLIAHLKKTKMENMPDLEDLRDSSFIAQEADTVLMLWRETKRENGEVKITNNVNLSVQANRRTGKTGNVKMVYSDGHFNEQAWEDPELNKVVDEVTGKKEKNDKWKK